MKKTDLKIRKVKNSDTLFLYELLLERSPKISISHRKMPNYIQHTKFVTSKPYAFWYILFENGKKIGSVYLTALNEIGISLVKQGKRKGLEEEVLKIIMEKHSGKRFFVNISPKNKKLELLVKKFGFKMIQKTYEFERMSNEKN